MRRKYSTGLLLLLSGLAVSARVGAAPCPPEIADTARRVATLRHLPASFAPPCRWIDAAHLRSELDAKLRRDLPVPPLTFLEVLTRFGLAEGNPAELYQRLLDFYSSQVLGFYEPDDDTMILVSGSAAASSMAESVWAHELAHAAQQHRFRLPERLLALRDNGDEQRTVSAIAEGEAMLVMFLLEPGADAASLAEAERSLARQAATTLAPPGLPEYFVADLVFPYTAGFSTVLRAYTKSGWPGVDALLRHPPTSTAALLHAEAPPPDRPVPDQELPAVPAGWQPVITDTVGEWALRFLLRRHLPESRADALARGWAGDRVRLIRRPGQTDRWALAWRLNCRDEPAAVALEKTFQDVLPAAFLRLPGPGTPLNLEVRRNGNRLDVRANWPETRPASERRSP